MKTWQAFQQKLKKRSELPPGSNARGVRTTSSTLQPLGGGWPCIALWTSNYFNPHLEGVTRFSKPCFTPVPLSKKLLVFSQNFLSSRLEEEVTLEGVTSTEGPCDCYRTRKVTTDIALNSFFGHSRVYEKYRKQDFALDFSALISIKTIPMLSPYNPISTERNPSHPEGNATPHDLAKHPPFFIIFS